MTKPRKGGPPVPVVEWAEDGEMPKRYRKVHFDEVRGKLVLFDLDQPEGDGEKEFKSVDSDGTDFKVVDDHVETTRMRKQRLYDSELAERAAAKQSGQNRQDKPVTPPSLKPRDQRTWETNQKYLRQILNNPARIAGRPAYEFYTDRKWMDQVLRDVAKKNGGVLVKAVTRPFWQAMRYGVDSASVMPLTDRSGAGGEERPAEEGAPRGGAPASASRLEGMPKPEKGGLTEAWRKRIRELMEEWIRECWDDDLEGIDPFAARVCFRAKSKFFEAIRARHFLKTDTDAMRRGRPSGEMVKNYVDWCLDKYFDDIVAEAGKAERNARGLPAEPAKTKRLGTTRVRGAGILKKIQMDGTVARNFTLVQEDEEGNFRDVRKPCIVLATSGEPMVVVGWFVSIRPEAGEAYRRCLCNVFSDKVDRLRELGLNPKMAAGIFPGYGDEVETDRKPGRAFNLWALDEARLNAELTLPWTPEQKGQVESTNGHIKRLLDELVCWGQYLIENFKGAYMNREAINKALPKGADAVAKMVRGRTLRRMTARSKATIRLTYRAFERLLVECINRWNTRRMRSRKTASLVNRRRTPASIYCHGAKRRVGAQALNDRGARQISLAMLKKHDQKIRDGMVQYQGCHYGIGASRGGEFDAGAEELIKYLDTGKDDITFTVPQDKLTIEWLKDKEKEEWITLRAVVTSVDDFGQNADLFDLEANAMLANADEAEQDAQDYDEDPFKDETRVDEAYQENEKAIRDQSHQATATQKKAARQNEKESQGAKDFAHVDGAKKKAAKAATQVFPEKSALGDTFDMDEYQTLFASFHPDKGSMLH